MIKNTKGEITVLLDELKNNKEQAEPQLIALLYHEMRRFAGHLLKNESKNHTFQATELVNEAYLRLTDSNNVDWEDRKHFFSAAVVAMRRVLVDHSRKKISKKRIPKSALTPVDQLTQDSQLIDETDVLKVDDALNDLEKFDQLQAKIVEVRYFTGFNETEVAELLNFSRSTVQREWRMAKMWLMKEMSA